MIKTPIELQELRRKIYVKAKTEPSWRFWGLYLHVCKVETLRAAFRLAKKNNGAPGIDGVSFMDIESDGVERFIEQLRKELTERTYRPARVRKVEIPKGGGKFRVLSIPTIRDRVVQGALKLILEPIFEADFQPGSFGYRPRKTPQDAVERVSDAIVQGKTHVIDLDLRAYFDTVRHHLLLEKMALRIEDADVLHLLKMIMKSTGKRGVPQGGVISPLLSNIYLTELDRMLERAKEVTRLDGWTQIEYVRFADDLVVLVSSHRRQRWLQRAVANRIREELAKLQVEVNEEKTKTVDLTKGESFGFLGFEFRRVRNRAGRWIPLRLPQGKKRTALLQKLKDVFRCSRSRPVGEVIMKINPILRGWVRYFASGHSSRCFSYVRNWVELKIRRHLARACKRSGFGWKRWRTTWLYDVLKLFNEYSVRRYQPPRRASPAR